MLPWNISWQSLSRVIWRLPFHNYNSVGVGEGATLLPGLLHFTIDPYLIIFTNPSAHAGYDTRSIFKRSLTGFEFRVFFLLDKTEELSLPYYLPIAGGRIIGFLPFPRVLVLCEMQSISSRIWTRVTVYISYDDNHYTTGTSIHYGHLLTL